MSNCIVCGIDNSSGARRAASVAARLARDLQSRALLIHVTEGDRPLPHSLGLPRLGRARKMGKMLEAIAEEHCFPADTQVRLEAGNPVAGLMALAIKEDAELVVVSARGRSEISAALLGGVASALMRKSPCPVVVVPPNSIETVDAASMQSLVCGVEGSETDAGVLRLAADLTGRLGGQLHAVHAYDSPSARGAVPAAVAPPTDLDLRDSAERTLALALEEADVDASACVLPIPAHDALERAARQERAGLVVVGSQGRNKLGSILHGSVTTRLAAGGSTPLVVLPSDAQLELGSGHYELAAAGAA